MSNEAISIPTPDISHLTEEDYEHVYEPAEDTFILLDALEQDALELRDLKPALCLEIGLGSGVVSTFLSILLGPTETSTSSLAYMPTLKVGKEVLIGPIVMLGVDINPHACSTAARTAVQNGVSTEIVRSDLLSPLKRVYGKVDVLVFNPPYVPTEELEFQTTQDDRGIGGAWAGGGDGMGLTNLVLPLIPEILAPGGRFYLVAVAPNKPLDIIANMQDLGLDAEVVLKRRAGREHLSIIRMIKPPTP